MGLPPDENLPEVVPDSSPQAISDVEAQYKQRGYGDDHDKYPVQYDDTPKILSGGAQDQAGTDHLAAQSVPSAVSPTGSVPWEPVSAVEETPAGQGAAADEKAPDERRICGLRRKIFFIALIVAFIILAAAIGGGVGGGLASRNRSESPSTTSSASPTSTSASSTSSTSTSASATPTFLNNQTGTGSINGDAFQGFADDEYQGKATPVYLDEGFHDLPFNCSSYVWLPNITNCCITFCKNKKDSAGFRCAVTRQTKSSTPFSRISIWCGEPDPNNTTKSDDCSG